MKQLILKVALLFFCVLGYSAHACECPYTALSLDECAKYEIIFRGKIISVKPCGEKPGEAVFEIEELYKGNSEKEFKVLFECDDPCATKFAEGEEWIIYSRYKQIGNAMMDWCSRSRKYFKNDNEDFYAVTYGNDYYDEAKFLKANLGTHRLLQSKPSADYTRNKIPGVNKTIILVVCSLLAIVLFYWLFNRFFKF